MSQMSTSTTAPTGVDISDLSSDDQHRLLLAAQAGYAHVSPKNMLLVDLGYMEQRGIALYPTRRGWWGAVAVAEATWRTAADSGAKWGTAVAEYVSEAALRHLVTMRQRAHLNAPGGPEGRHGSS